MGLLDFLSSASTVGTQAAAAHEKGLAEGQNRETQDLLQRIQLARQQNADALNRQLTQSTIKLHGAQTQKALEPPAPVRRQDVTLKIGGKAAAGSYDPVADKYYYQGQEVQNPERFQSPDPMTRFFEGQRQEQDQREAAEWQRHYDRLVTPKMTKYGTVEEGTGLPPAEAAAQADEIYGGHPRLAPRIAPKPLGPPPPMGTTYTPSRMP